MSSDTARDRTDAEQAHDGRTNGSVPRLEHLLAASQQEGLDANAHRWFGFLGIADGEWFELQALAVPTTRGAFNKYAFVRSHRSAIALLQQADANFNAQGIYLLMNRIVPAAATRAAPDKWHDSIKGSSTTDRDVAARRAIMIDCDAVRPTGTSATDVQVRATARVALAVHARLVATVGCEALAYSHSGNGRGLYIAIDHVAESPALSAIVKGLLTALSIMHSVADVAIDGSVSDAKRLCPAFGTTKRKGVADNAEYPHRRTCIITPRTVRRVGFGELEQLVTKLRAELDDAQRAEVDKAMGVRPAKPSAPAPKSSNANGIDRSDTPFTRANAVDVEQVATWLDLYESGHLRCPGCGETSGVDLIGNGLKCLHARCSSKGRNGFRTPVDLVAEVRRGSPREAVDALAERFGFEGFGRREQTAPRETARAANDASEPRLKIWTPDEIWAPLEPPDYVVDQVLVRANVALLCATGSSLKTFVAVDAVCGVATGTNWLGRFPCKQGGALIIDWESGDYELRRRLQKVARGRGHDSPLGGVGFVTMPDLFFSSPDFMDTVTELGKDRALIVLDSLAAGSPDVDENDARFARGLNHLKRAGVATGCAFLVLHHSRKSAPGAEQGDERDKPRGTGAIFAACDVVLQVNRGKGGVMVISQTKGRCGPAVRPFAVRVDDQPGGAISVLAADADESATTQAEPLDRMKANAIRVLAGARDIRSKNEICRRLKGSKNVKLNAIDELVERGIVSVVDGAFRLSSEVANG